MASMHEQLIPESPNFYLDDLLLGERTRLENDLRLAAFMQEARFPKCHDCFETWDSYHYCRPAEFVGGDCCDVLESGGKLLFLLADISGKGLGASLLASHLHATFRGLACGGLRLEKMVEAANAIFYESSPSDQFATLVVGYADRDGSVEFVSAGHTPFLYVGHGGVRSENATGVPLGLFPNFRFPSSHLMLEPGESLLICTDGVTEAQNAIQQQYGIRRLERVAGWNHDVGPAPLLEKCVRDLQSFTGETPLTDDVTLLSIRRRLLRAANR
jgi:sigma-B regulation protein RsbU (phosphoserine phosphatase)